MKLFLISEPPDGKMAVRMVRKRRICTQWKQMHMKNKKKRPRLVQ
jgi:hypothetical protein